MRLYIHQEVSEVSVMGDSIRAGVGVKFKKLVCAKINEISGFEWMEE